MEPNTTGTPTPTPPVVVALIHPDNIRNFHRIASSTAEIKKNRSMHGYVCRECHKTSSAEIKVLQCARRGTAQGRPKHKSICVELKASTAKLIPSFVANPALYFYLGKALVMLFKIHENPRPDIPLVAMCEAELRIADPVRAALIASGHVQPDPEGKDEAMLQIRSLQILDPRIAMERTRKSMWNTAREGLRSDGRPSVHVIMLDFTIKDVKWQGTTYAFPIEERVVEAVKSGAISVRKSVVNGTTVRPSSVQTCIEPAHKANCQDMNTATAKLIPTLVANEYLSVTLAMALTLLYGLHSSPRPDSHFVAKCEAEIVPSDFARHLFLATSQARVDNEEGMLELSSLTPLDPKEMMETTRTTMWKGTKDTLHKLGHPDQHVIIVDFKIKGVKQGTTVAIPIDNAILKTVSMNLPAVRKSAISGTLTFPQSVEMYLE
uniref:DUF8205 domain-containing protein n=1 Tax=Psilocybe cubensis TaxID=181762 RepID=A0A8H7XN06_PSICU